MIPLIFLSFVIIPAANSGENLMGDQSSGSRSNVVHVLELLDENGQKIFPDDNPAEPFSTRNTCGSCHNYLKISSGWHSNQTLSTIKPGRAGEPWIFVDRDTRVQMPLSYRNWPGTFKPQQIGMSGWEFTSRFGPFTPGGSVGEIDTDYKPRELVRSHLLSGKLELNCLSCHDADSVHDQAQYASQVGRQNFRWAPAAGTTFASVEGSAKSLPGTYDLLQDPLPDDPKRKPPVISYNQTSFDDKNKVLFDITLKAPNERCYFCHSNKYLDESGSQKWAMDEDVHLSAGLLCVDCHRNGLGHDITRGYEGESDDSLNQLADIVSCKGCHIGDETSSIPIEGRLGAPVAKHKGIPLVHFKKLSCTACHSGPWPKDKTTMVKTSRAHKLGAHGVNKSDDALPHIIAPVFVKQANGKIAPHKLLWPAYWGYLKGEIITPIAPDVVADIAGDILADDQKPQSQNSLEITAEQINKVLTALSAQETQDGKPVYISGGKIYQLTQTNELIDSQHPQAQPYSWPIAHNVRPAAQSLGSRGCADCHATNKPFFFGEVEVDSPLASAQNSVKIMAEFEKVNVFYTKIFALLFVFRPWLKIVCFAACAVLGLVLLSYAFKALDYILKIQMVSILKKFVYRLMLLCLAILVISGFTPSLILGRSIWGYLLMAHVITGPVFVACLVVLTLIWARPNRFEEDDFGPLLRFIDADKTDKERPLKSLGFWYKIWFWLIVILALAVTLSIILSMLKFMGTLHAQELLLEVHRYCSILLTLVIIVHTFLILRRKEL